MERSDAAQVAGDGRSRFIPWLSSGGTLLVIVGTFLPWIAHEGVSLSAWELPMRSLVFHEVAVSAFSVGAVLLVSLLSLAALLTREPLPPLLYVILGGFLVAMGTLDGKLALQAEPHLIIGVGAFGGIAGGILIACEYARARTWRGQGS